MPCSKLEIPIDQNWQLISDQVMGGISNGSLIQTVYQDKPCLHLSGHVSTSNNGGFLQMGFDLTRLPGFEPAGYSCLRLTVSGNLHQYNIHLKTRDLNRPWQSFRYQFATSTDWQPITVSFEEFRAHRTDETFKKTELGPPWPGGYIGSEFDASLYLHQIEFS